MEFEIRYKGVRYGTVRFEVDPSFYEPILARLGMFGLGFEPIPDPPAPASEPEGKAGRRG